MARLFGKEEGEVASIVAIKIQVQQKETSYVDKSYKLSLVSSYPFSAYSGAPASSMGLKMNDYGFFSDHDHVENLDFGETIEGVWTPAKSETIWASIEIGKTLEKPAPRKWRRGGDDGKDWEWRGKVTFSKSGLYHDYGDGKALLAKLNPPVGVVFISSNYRTADKAKVAYDHYVYYFTRNGYTVSEEKSVKDLPKVMGALIASKEVNFAIKDGHSGGSYTVVALSQEGTLTTLTNDCGGKFHILTSGFEKSQSKFGRESESPAGGVFEVENEKFADWFRVRVDENGGGPLFFINASCTSKELTVNLVSTVSPKHRSRLVTIYTDQCVSSYNPIYRMLDVIIGLTKERTYTSMRRPPSDDTPSDQYKRYVYPDEDSYKKTMKKEQTIAISAETGYLNGGRPAP